jgi:hypothetical protein
MATRLIHGVASLLRLRVLDRNLLRVRMGDYWLLLR